MNRKLLILLSGAVALLVFVNVGFYLSMYESPSSFYSLSSEVLAFQDDKYSSGFLADIVDSLNNQDATIQSSYAKKIDEAYAVNKDVIGWLTVEEWGIDYPVLLGETNKTYLRTALDGSYSLSGSIFMDANYPDAKSKIKLLHGHNMQDGKWFSQVPSLFDLDDLASAPKIVYTDINGTKEFSFISVFSANSKEESVIITRDWFELDDLKGIKSNFVDRSWVPCSEVPDGVELLMLNTCWYGESGHERNLRCIAVAVRTG